MIHLCRKFLYFSFFTFHLSQFI